MLPFLSVTLVVVSLHSNGVVTKREVNTRAWSIAVMGLTMLLLMEYKKLWDFGLGMGLIILIGP